VIGEILKPPTDNLYKFISICGLTLFLISITVPPWLLNKTWLAYYETDKDLRIVELELQDFRRRQEEGMERDAKAYLEISELSKELFDPRKAATEQSARSANRDLIKSKIDEQKRKGLERHTAEMELLLSQARKTAEMSYKVKVLAWQQKTSKVLAGLCILGAVTGLVIGWKGFRLWSLRVQAFQDAILKKQAEQEQSAIANQNGH
jgi:hypothetical protein